MIYSDGAGASVIEASDETGLLSYESSTYAMDEANYFFGKSYNPESDPDTRYIKMHGRKIYEFALTTVPAAMKSCLTKAVLQ
jgi:3-oxoacyl-[acyl-carrier-protein] synthase-3